MLKKRILAIDLGTKRVGLAISDPLNIIAQAYKTIEFIDRKTFVEALKKIIEEKNIGSLIFGLPSTLDGKESQKTKEVRAHVDSFKAKLPKDLLIEFEDESLTSKEAEAIIGQMGKKPSQNKALIDQIAAQRILQRYMDRI